MLAAMRLPFTRNRPKIDPLMSQPYSPTGKRFIRPIIARDLKDPPKPPAPVDHHREELRRIIVALGLWIAFLLMVYRLIGEHSAAATKFLHP